MLGRAHSSHIKNIERLRIEIGLGQSDFAGLMHMRRAEYLYYSHIKRDIPAHALQLLSDRLNISVKKLLRGDYDSEAALRHFSGDQSFLPLAHIKNAFSKMRTLDAALNFSAMRFHPTVKKGIFKELQLPPAMRSNLDRGVSVKALNDIFVELEVLGAEDVDYYRIGQRSCASYLKSKLGETLIPYRGKKEFWEAVFEPYGGHIEMVDKNFVYEVMKVTNETVILKMFSRDWMQESFSCRNFGHKGFAYNGAGFTSSLGVAFNGHPCESKVLKCFALGDPYNLIEIKIVG